MLSLPPEILRMILDFVEEGSDQIISHDRRDYLSQESFRLPTAPTHDQAETIASFRLVCRRFAATGAAHQFARVTTRFSRAGFERLERIAGSRDIAKHVRKFTFMVPYFYLEGREHVDEVLPELQQTVGLVDAELFARKIADQRHLVQSREDARIITKAMAAFTSLQHIQLLRVQDRDDAMLLGYIRRHEHLTARVNLDWAYACNHSTNLLGAAVLATESKCSRFSSPMLSLEAPYTPSQGHVLQLGNFAHQLTCLELHFDDAHDLEDRVRELSPTFNSTLLAASQLKTLHIGFPSQRPLDLGLEEVFHNIKWANLTVFGIQGWKLSADEIIGFARRHRETVRGLRLRDAQLREPSMWKDVLFYLREDMPLLDWVSLRRIGYARHFEEQLEAAGAEVPDDPPEDASDSEEFVEEEQSTGVPSNDLDVGTSSELSASAASFEDDSDAAADEEEEFGSQAHGISFPESTFDAGAESHSSFEEARPADIDDLGDNGVFVTNTQRKQWERWVIKRWP